MLSDTYKRTALKKNGIVGLDYMKVINPENFTFKFLNDKGLVRPQPANNVLMGSRKDAYDKFIRLNHIEQGSCHLTALLAAMSIPGCKVCDGFYVPLQDPDVAYAHTSCKIGDIYFDPTIENVFGKHAIDEYRYYSVRIFEPKEFLLFGYAVACKNNLGTTGYSVCGTLENDGIVAGESEIAKMVYVLDDEGHFIGHKPPITYKYPFAI